MGKLTKAQERFLASLSHGGIHCMDMSHAALAMTAKLKERGLVERYFRGFGQWGYQITEAGRAALQQKATPHEQ